MYEFVFRNDVRFLGNFWEELHSGLLDIWVYGRTTLVADPSISLLGKDTTGP